MKTIKLLLVSKTIRLSVFIVFLSIYAVDFIVRAGRQDSFTWMDPYQYFNFARDFVSDIRAYNQFELPSIFPFFLVPFLKVSPTIPAALSANLFFLAALLVAAYYLCGYFTIQKRYGVLAISFLCSPLVIGLSHSLYPELALCALVVWQYVLWFKSDHFAKPWVNAAFFAVFCVGMMTKSTYPIFFIGPYILETVLLVRKKNIRGAAVLFLIFFGAIVTVVAIEKYAFPNSFEYYTTGFYTKLPIMSLIGPSKVSKVASLAYYFVMSWKTMLFLLTPFMVLPLLPALRKKQDLFLWAWFLISLLALTVPQVKEPRHAAPALVPAIMLAVLGIGRISRPTLRKAVVLSALALASAQWYLVTRQVRATPYFLDRPSYHGKILAAMVSADEARNGFVDPEGIFDSAQWKFTKNFAITGYDGPMALSLAWNLSPGVTYDIDYLRGRGANGSRYGFDNFEDLYFLEAFNMYNRQCLWDSDYMTLDYQTVIDNADYLVAGENAPQTLSAEYSRFRVVKQWKTDKGAVRLLQATQPSNVSYRTLYARRYLAQGKLDPATKSALYFDLLLNAALRRNAAQIIDLQKELTLNAGSLANPKNIYWTRDRAALIERMNAYLKGHNR